MADGGSLILLLLVSPVLTASTTPQRLRIVQYNIHAFRTAEHIDSLDSLCALLAPLHPDVLCLNEVLHPWVPPSADDPYWEAVLARRGYEYAELPNHCYTGREAEAGAHLHRLADALGLKHIAFVMANDQGFFGRGVPFGNAILSRYPFDDTAELIMRPAVPADLTLGEQSRTVQDLEPRSALLVGSEGCLNRCCDLEPHLRKDLGQDPPS